MTPFLNLDAVAAPLPLANVDTDKILAARFLKTISREGLGVALFSTLRQDPEFVLNRTPWTKAEILVALDNFGCGSSREHAPWALLDFGIRCVIAPSIADIFYTNCLKNGILPITLVPVEVEGLLDLVADPAKARLQIDLPTQTIWTIDGRVLRFQIDTRHKHDLIHGVDEIGRSLELEPRIAAYEAERELLQPWLPKGPLKF